MSAKPQQEWVLRIAYMAIQLWREKSLVAKAKNRRRFIFFFVLYLVIIISLGFVPRGILNAYRKVAEYYTDMGNHCETQTTSPENSFMPNYDFKIVCKKDINNKQITHQAGYRYFLSLEVHAKIVSRTNWVQAPSNDLVENIQYEIKVAICIPIIQFFDTNTDVISRSCYHLYQYEPQSRLQLYSQQGHSTTCQCFNNQGGCSIEYHKCPYLFEPNILKQEGKPSQCICKYIWGEDRSFSTVETPKKPTPIVEQPKTKQAAPSEVAVADD